VPVHCNDCNSDMCIAISIHRNFDEYPAKLRHDSCDKFLGWDNVMLTSHLFFLVC